MPTEPDVLKPVRSAYALTEALRIVLNRIGDDVGVDELHAALGLGLLACADENETPPHVWSAYARDAFLVQTGRLYGATVRPVHPPSAARGLMGRAEFRQHFEASYAPLVQRALEHEQSVLVWGGWPAPHSRDWGLITSADSSGLGFQGAVYHRADASGPESSPECTPLVVQSPPTQVYVVETTTGERPSRSELVRTIVAHTRSALHGVIDDAFGVVTGVRAVDAWLLRLDADATCGDLGFLQAMLAGAQSLRRTLERNPVNDVPGASPMAKACETIVARIGDVGDDPRSVGAGVREVLAQLTRAI